MARPWPRVVFLSLLPKRAVLMCHLHHSGQTHDDLCHSVDIRTVQAHMVALRHAIKSASHVCGLQRIGGPNTPWQQTCLYIGRPLSSPFTFFFMLPTYSQIKYTLFTCDFFCRHISQPLFNMDVRMV